MKWKNVPTNINNFCSFVYKISFDDGSFYIGYKKFWKKILKVPSGGRYIESDWKNYNSSSKYVRRKIKSYKGNISFEILECHKNVFDSIESEMNNIKRYRIIYPNLILNLTDGFTTTSDMEIARRKALSRAHLGKKFSEETKEKMRKFRNDPVNKEKFMEQNLKIARNPATIEKLKNIEIV